jgi:phosphoribosylaminoimidazolecarboxamide formyltransferase/IMP cyclohydrolase
MKNIVKIKRALISVSDKSLLENLLPFLSKYKIEIISSGKTYKKIKKLNFKSIEISNFTGSSEMLGGRIKTLHPKIHAGILNVRSNRNHRLDLIKHNFKEIDLIIVNFYPFENVIKKNNSFKSIIENIDIGGPTLVRAAAKNFGDVLVVTSPKNYINIVDEINKYKGSTSLNFRKQMAINAFNEVANYDSIIANYFNDKFDVKFPNKKTFTGKLVQNLRYGENPHQKAAIYSNENNSNIKQLHGKKLSFNNYNDIFSALSISKSFEKNNGTVIIKHANPCGVSVEKNNLKSFNLAFNCDPVSAYGGIVSCNYKIKKELAKKLNQSYFEIIIANEFEKNALKILKKKKNVRLIDASNFHNKGDSNILFYKKNFLYQDSDDLIISKKNLKVVSKKKPSKHEIENLIFAFNICRYVKSNAIVLVKDKSTIGIGSGQPSRLDSCDLAINKAKRFQFRNLLNSVAASDAFFPFTDGFEKLIQSGVSAVIQPQGSIRDKEIIKLADKTGTVLIFSKTRHFKH